MDTFSTSVSSSKVPRIHQTPSAIHQFRIFNSSYHHSSSSTVATPVIAATTTTTKPTSISVHNTKLTTSGPPSHSQLIKPPKQTSVHHKAASGYAAALIDVAICNNSLEATHYDIRRLSKWLKHDEQQLKTIIDDPFMAEGKKGRIVKDVLQKGRFRRHLVVLVKMLVEKNKLGMVGGVLNEFERIYSELSCTLRVVMV